MFSNAARRMALKAVSLGASLCAGLAVMSEAPLAQGLGQGIGQGSAMGSSAVGVGRRGGAQVQPQVIQPPALPGARSPSGSVAPASRIPTDMPPTEALFDAVNRGDIASVRDAISRGAELNRPNVLGLTPLELSVDLGRNDISFLLLSMRGETGRAAGNRQADPSGAPKAALRQNVAATRPPASKPPAQAKKTAMPAASTSMPSAGPRLFANDGGVPNPSAGFLGFDTGRSER